MQNAGDGPIILDDLQCVGHEARLADCPHAGLQAANCLHSEDVSLVCSNDTQGICVGEEMGGGGGEGWSTS